MAITITGQPGVKSLVAAYRPILFTVNANQQPNGPAACPIVMADVYINGVYYSSISVTDYDVLVLFFVFNVYKFDIQDKIQEYLNSNFARFYENTNGDIENENVERYSCSVQVKFRESYIDTNGFTVFYGTAPIQGTKFTAPVAGTGTATSNLFYVLNATLTHEDNQNLESHLNEFKETFQDTYTLSHRPNILPGTRIAEGQYFTCKNDNDYIFYYSKSNIPSGWFVSVNVKYNDGSIFTPPPANYVVPGSPSSFKVYSFNAGIPNLSSLFPTVNWNNVIEYEIVISAPFFQAIRQYYYVNQCGCCYEHTRIFFLNNLGTYDAMNFESKQEINKTESAQWQSSLPALLSSKSASGTNRMQVKQNDYYEVQCKCYYEKDMNWIKEILGTSKAYLQWDGIQGQPNGLMPIIIADSEVITLKNKEQYEYIIVLKYSLANERINIRN